MPTPRIGIIADDLTGATDVAAAFSAAGFRSAVALNGRRLNRFDVDALCLSTHSRHDPPDEAARKVGEACRQLRDAGFPLRYKKLDSTAKGNILAEAIAARDEGGFQRSLVCTANPAQERVIQQGKLWVHGQLTVDLRTRFSTQTQEEIRWIHQPIDSISLEQLRSDSSRLWVCDATTQAELDRLVRFAQAKPTETLLTGSAGMAARLARSLTSAKSRAGKGVSSSAARGEASPRSRTTPMRPSLMIIGSNDPRTAEQIEVLTTQRRTLQLTANAGLPSEVDDSRDPPCTVILRIPVNRTTPKILRSGLHSLKGPLSAGRFGSLLLCGGDTALLVCDWLQVLGIDIEGELFPGLTWGRFRGGLVPGMPVCTKPGGFGSSDSLMLAADRLSNCGQSSKTVLKRRGTVSR